MKEQFVPYEQALKLKELGFKNKYNFKEYDTEGFLQHTGLLESHKLESIDAPLWQQSFDWFREMHELIYNITFKDDNYKFSYGNINSATNLYMPQYPTYEEARLACLEKLIELVSSV